jgi:hypothetical protein
MPAGEYLGQEEFQLTVGPSRVAYLIRANSRGGYRRAVQEASTRWGGFTEPIVPVKGGGRIDAAWSQFVEFANLDEVVNIDVDHDEAVVAARSLGLPLERLADIDSRGAGQYTCHPSVTSHVIAPPTAASDLFPSHWPVPAAWSYADNALDLWAVTAAGSLTNEALQELRGLGDPSAVLADPMLVALAQIGERTGLDRTAAQLQERLPTPAPFPYPAVIWVCSRNSLLECIRFWNLRALRPMAFIRWPMLLVPAYEVDNWMMFGQQVQALFTGRPDEFSPDVFLCSNRVPPERLREIAESWGLIESTEAPRVQMRLPPPASRTPPFTYLLNRDPRQVLLRHRTYGSSTNVATQVFRDRTAIQFESPVQFQGNGRFKLTISSDVLKPLPRRDAVAHLVHANSHWSATGLELFHQVAPRRYQVDIRVPHLREVVTVILAEVTTATQPSDKGRLGEAVASTAGIASLLQPGLIQAIGSLTTRRSTHVRRQRERLQRTDGSDVDESATSLGTRLERKVQPANELEGVAKGDRVTVAESLVAMGWAERGYRIECTRCSVASFVELKDVTSRAECPGCRTPQAYKRTPTGITVYYRLNSLIDLASDQGVLPHLLAVAALTRKSPDTDIIPGLNVKFADQTSKEIDLFGVHGGMVLGGEVKASASEFTQERIRRDIDLSSRLGADIHVMACAEALSNGVIDFATERAKSKGLEISVLDFTHLEGI